MVVPFGESNYYNARPSIAIPKPASGNAESAIDLEERPIDEDGPPRPGGLVRLGLEHAPRRRALRHLRKASRGNPNLPEVPRDGEPQTLVAPGIIRPAAPGDNQDEQRDGRRKLVEEGSDAAGG